MPRSLVPGEDGTFLEADLGGGRSLTGAGGRLSYRANAALPPVVVELGRLRRLELETHAFREALALVAFVVLGALARSPLLMAIAFAVAALGGLLATLCRSHALLLETEEGGRLRWPLGLARRGSERDIRLLAAWMTLADVMKARGVPVEPVAAPPPPPAPPSPEEGPRA